MFYGSSVRVNSASSRRGQACCPLFVVYPKSEVRRHGHGIKLLHHLENPIISFSAAAYCIVCCRRRGNGVWSSFQNLYTQQIGCISYTPIAHKLNQIIYEKHALLDGSFNCSSQMLLKATASNMPTC